MALSAITLAWVVISCGQLYFFVFFVDSCGNSLGWVCIQPRGSRSLRYSYAEVAGRVGSSTDALRRHNNAVNFLHLRIVRWTHAVKVTRYLRPQVWNGHELLTHVLGQKNVSIARLFDVVRLNEDVVRSKVKVGSRNSLDSPFGLELNTCVS